MAFSKNSVEVIGFLGADPVLRYTPNGKAVCDVNVATNSYYKDADGNSQQNTEWIRCTFWGKNAENLAQYMKKGSQIHVQGRLKTDRVGEGEAAKYYTKVICDINGLGFLGTGGGSTATPDTDSAEEIPF
jgi:single-strand DNA-binding protein